MHFLRSAVAALVTVTFLSLSYVPVVHAQNVKPWAEGVPVEEQQAANKLYKEGNGLVRDSFLSQAVEKYTEALSHWDHPAIHYNLAIALIGASTERPLEVYEHLIKAMGFEGKALSEDELKEANRYLSLVQQQLIKITVVCDTPDAEVFLDGKKLFVGPGSKEELLRAGEHTLSASKPGYETAVVTQIIPGGEEKQVKLKLYKPEELTRYHRRFQQTWLPYAVGGGGFALAAIGGLLHASAASSYDSYDAAVRSCVEDGDNMSCDDSAIAGDKSSGDTKQGVAVTMYFVGGAAIAAGLTMLILNRAKPYRISPDEADAERTAVVPIVGKDTVGVSALFHF